MSKTKYGLAVVLSLVLVFGFVGFSLWGISPPPSKEPVTVMILKSWTTHLSMPYDQGFEQIEVYEGEVADWTLVETLLYDTVDIVIDIAGGSKLKLIVYTWLNSTLVGAGSGAAGKLYQRHGATISFLNETIAYTYPSNFTYESVDTGIDPPLWMYEYSAILDYDLGYGSYFVVDVSYETYY